MKQVLKYPGAKYRLANWIVNNMPEHSVYLEPYAGSLSVLLNKPRCHIETVNDLHGEVVNFFRVLRDNPHELKRLIELGLKRIGCADVPDPSVMKHKQMRYEGIIDMDSDRVYWLN